MTEAYIYDHVRTPGSCKKDGALDEVPPSGSPPMRSKPSATVTWPTPKPSMTSSRLRRSGDEAGLGDPRAAAFEAGYDNGRRDCRSRASAPPVSMPSISPPPRSPRAPTIFPIIAVDVESIAGSGIGMSGGAWPIDPSVAVPAYFMPQGVSVT